MGIGTRRHRLALACTAATTLALTGCTAPFVVEPAPYAADAGCASIMLAAPEELGGLPLRATSSQATAAYGDEPVIVVRCGVEPPGPTEDRCVAIETPTAAQDWILTEEGDNWRAVSFGRSPAVEVLIPKARADQAVAELLAVWSGSAALAEPNGLACR